MAFVSGTHETAQGQSIAAWFGNAVGKEQHGPYSALGVTRDGALETAVLFNDYNGSNIEIHMVGRMSRHAIREAFRYAFLQMKVQRVTGKPYRSSIELRDRLLRLGFVPEGVMHRYYGPSSDDDAIVYRLDRDAAEKWMV